MSTSEQEQQPTIIYLEPELYIQSEYEESTNKSPIDLQNQPELPVSCSGWNNTYTAFHIDERLVVIEITATDTLVKIKYPWRSKPLHIHIIEHLCPVCDLYGNEFDKVSGHTIFVIFNDHILRIRLENRIFIHLEDRKLGSLFEECKTDFSFHISEPESSSFTIIEDERNERLRACLVLDETSWKKVELFEINLFRDDECIFTKRTDFFFRLPLNTKIEIAICNFSVSYVELHSIIDSNGKLTECLIKIPNHKSIDESDHVNPPIIVLTDSERCILAKIEQLERFQSFGFQIVAKIYGLEDDDDFPEIKSYVKDLLELNKYHTCHQDDSDPGSDSD
jgi:hypothetical protein